MITLTTTAEFLTDLFTTDIASNMVMTAGLPSNTHLISITQDKLTNVFTFIFDDGKEENTVAMLTYERKTPQ